MIEKAPSFTKEQIEYMNLGIALNETTEKSELETYKKIAEFLASEWFDTDMVFMIRLKGIHNSKELFNWARSEVLKNDNGNIKKSN